MGFGKCGEGGERETVQREIGQYTTCSSALLHSFGTLGKHRGALNEDPLKGELRCLKSDQFC